MTLPAPAASAQAPLPESGIRVTVTAFVLHGNTVIASVVLLAALTDLTGHPIGTKDLQTAADRITAIYQKQGYVLARAVLPAQEVKDGIVVIQILEGRLHDAPITNRSEVPDWVIHDASRSLQAGQVTQAAPLEQSLLLLNDLPGVLVHSTLRPGPEIGTTDLDLQLDPAKKYFGSVSVDNEGNTYTGEGRLNGSLGINNPLHLGDVLTLQSLISTEHQHYEHGQYELPVGLWDTRVGGSYSWMNYRLAKSFSPLDATGTAAITDAYLLHPWIRRRDYGLSSQFSYDNKQLDDKTGAVGLDSRKALHNFTLAFTGYWRDAIGGAAGTSYSLGWTSGIVDLRSADAQLEDALDTAGHFRKWTLSFQRQQRLTNRLSLNLQVRGQLASKNLDSVEKILLGGINGVRAYPEGEAPGDSGWIANAELREVITPWWQQGLFFDGGGVVENKNPMGTPGGNQRRLCGAGLATYLQPLKSWQGSLTVAMPIHRETPTGGPNRVATLWGQLTWGF